MGGWRVTFRTRGVDEQDIFEFDVALEIFWTFPLIGEGVYTWDAVNGLKDLLRCSGSFSETLDSRSDLAEREGCQNHRKQDVHN